MEENNEVNLEEGNAVPQINVDGEPTHKKSNTNLKEDFPKPRYNTGAIGARDKQIKDSYKKQGITEENLPPEEIRTQDFGENSADVRRVMEQNRKRAAAKPRFKTTIGEGSQELSNTNWAEKFDYIQEHTDLKTSLTDGNKLIQERLIKAEYNEAKKNSQDQGFWGEFAGFAAQSVAGEVVMGTLEGIGYLLDVQHWGSKMMGAEGDWGNWFSDWAGEGKEWIREVAPIHADPDNANRTMWENMLHGDGWWAENGVSVASTASILIPVAGWARGAALAGKGLNYLGQAGRLGKLGRGLAKGTKTVDKMMDAMPMASQTTRIAADGIHKAVISRLIESQMEATGVFKEKYDYYMEQEDMSEEDARKAAGKAASFTYNWNWLAMATDIPQYMMLGAGGKALRKTLHAKKPGWLKNNNILNKTKGFRATGSTMFSEGIEEGYQFIVAEEGKRMGDIQAGLVDPNESTLFGNDGENRFNKYLNDAEMQTSMVFGALGGGVFSAVGPSVMNLANKAFRKGETMLTAEDVRVNEAKTRYQRLAHDLDLVKQAEQTGDEEAIFQSKANLAFNMAREAETANNWDQAREAMAQLKNATPEEQEQYDIKEQFGDFVENIDEWIGHMDVAADLVSRAKGKYTYGLAEQVAARQFQQHLYKTQAPALANKIEQEKKNVIPAYDNVSKDGRMAVDMQLDIKGMELSLGVLEKQLESNNLTEQERAILEQQLKEGREFIESRQEAFNELVKESKMSKADKLAVKSVENGAEELTVASAKKHLLDLQNEKNIEELTYLTSRDGRREFKRRRAEAYKAAKAADKAKRAKEAQEKSREKTVDPTVEQDPQESVSSIDELNIAEVSEAIKNGASYSEFAKTDEDLFELKHRVADFRQRQQANPKAAKEEAEDDADLIEQERIAKEALNETGANITFNEKSPSDVEVEENTDDAPEDTDLSVDPISDLDLEIEASEYEDLEVPINKDSGSQTITDSYTDTTLSETSDGQLAWLSANNPAAKDVTPEQQALSDYLETPGNTLDGVEVVFEFNKGWLAQNKTNPRYVRMMKQLQAGQMPSFEDIGYMPMTAKLIKNGKPVTHKGVELTMSMHDPSFFFKKNGAPKYPGVSEYHASVTTLHKKAIISEMLKGNTVTTKLTGKSKGKLISEVDNTGAFKKQFIAQTFKKPISKMTIFVGDKKGNYVRPNGRAKFSLGRTATPGAFYVNAATANGKPVGVRLHANELGKGEATLIHRIYTDVLQNPSFISQPISDGILEFINNSEDPRITGMQTYIENLSEMTYQELLSHLVYEGSRTAAKGDYVLRHFVNTQSKKGVALPNVVQFGKDKLTVERLKSNAGKEQFITWLMNNKRRQVDAKRMESDAYKTYVNDTKILTTNAKTTPAGNLFVQPVINYSPKMKSTNLAATQAAKSAPTETLEQQILSLKNDLVFEAGEFGNKANIPGIESQIAALEKQLADRTKPTTEEAPVTEPTETTAEVTTEDTVETRKAKLEKLLADQGKVVLAEDGSGYTNTETGQKYQRVSNFIAEEEVEMTPLLESATTIGTKVDNLIRDFFKGTLDVETYVIGGKEGVASREHINAFVEQLKTFKAELDSRGETIMSDNIILFNDELGVAGEVDLLSVDKEGYVRIYDVKTMRGNNFKEKYKGDTLPKYTSKRFGKSKKQKHTDQISMYRILLNNTYGLTAKEIGVVPVQVGYPIDDKVHGTTKALVQLSFVPLTATDKIKTAELKKNPAVSVEKSKPVNLASSYKGIKVENTKNITTNEGTKGAAQYNSKNKTIKLDRELLQQKFAEKAWTNPRTLKETINGQVITGQAKELPADQFKTYQEWENFVIEHEYQHSIFSRAQFDASVPFETHVSDYETEINERALSQIEIDAGLKTAVPTEVKQPQISKNVANSIKMFQEGIKLEGGNTIKVNFLQSDLNEDSFEDNPC